MKILITGASGLLGRYLLRTQPISEGAPEGVLDYVHDVVPCYYTNIIEGIQLNVSNKESVLNTLWEIQPDIIIHCAANGDVDSVEKNPSWALESDLLGIVNLKRYAEKMKCKLITISSNAVYDGQNPPYSENSVRNPVNFYGKIKSLADDIIMASSCNWIIIRPIFLYGWNYKHGRGNWVTKILDALKEGKELKLVTDSYTQPTYAEDVSKFIWHLIEKDKWKVQYNVSAIETISLYEFGMTVRKVFGYYNNASKNTSHSIKPAKLKDFPEIAPRPVNTCFHARWINNYFKFSGIEEGLIKMKNEK